MGYVFNSLLVCRVYIRKMKQVGKSLVNGTNDRIYVPVLLVKKIGKIGSWLFELITKRKQNEVEWSEVK